MIVCVCKAVSDHHIRAAVNAGASGLRDISRDLGVGKCCGKCIPEAKAAIAAHLSNRVNHPQHHTSHHSHPKEAAVAPCFGIATPEFA